MDLGFIGYDIYSIITSTCEDNSMLWASLGMNVLGAVIPGVTGLGALTKAAKKLSNTKLYHGTSVSSARALASGSPLSLFSATTNKIDGQVGFFLTNRRVAAEFFATRRSPGAVLKYSFTPGAMKQLKNAGINPKALPAPPYVPGAVEYVVEPQHFDLFNHLFNSGDITVRIIGAPKP